MPSLKGLDLQVKWPNDLYSLQGKWGGILIEPISTQQVVVGVGINVSPLTEKVPDQQVTSLTELGLQHASRVDLIAELYLAIQQAGNGLIMAVRICRHGLTNMLHFSSKQLNLPIFKVNIPELSSAFKTMVRSLSKRMQVRRHFIRGNSVLKRWLNRHHSMKNYGWISAIHGSSTGLRSRTRSLNMPRKCICNPLPTYFLA